MRATRHTPWDLIDPETAPGKSSYSTTVLSRVGLRHKIMRRVAMRVLGFNTEAALDRMLATLAIEHAKKEKPEIYAALMRDLMQDREQFAALCRDDRKHQVKAEHLPALEAALAKFDALQDR